MIHSIMEVEITTKITSLLIKVFKEEQASIDEDIEVYCRINRLRENVIRCLLYI